MSDELKVWREACFAYGGASIEGAELEPSAAAVIRTYGDERHAAGYQAAIADVVEWLESDGVLITARAVARRFGKDA